MIKEYVVKITDDVIPDAFTRFEEEYSPEQELIRCKGCRYGEMDIEHFIRPSIVCKNPANGVGHVSHRPGWFCADGECKEGR